MKRAQPLVIAIVGTLLRLALVLRDPIAIDRLFMPDDAYYTLTIARSIGRGHGPSMDGVHLTNGFQPLLAFLLVPMPSVRAALTIGAISDGVTAYCLSRLARRLGGTEIAAFVGALVWALSPSAIATSMNGLETSLSIACLAVALVGFDEQRRWVGAVLGLCLLARVDSVFFVAAMGVALVRRGGIGAAVRHAGLAAIVVAPWWIYSLAHFGTFVPESGAAVRDQAMMYRETGLVVRDQLAWAAGAVVGPPFVDLTFLRQILGGTASGVGMVVAVGLMGGAGYLMWRRPAAPIAILTVHALCIFTFYALYLPATWFFRRYLVPVHLLTALIVAVRVTRHRAWLAWPIVAAVSIAPFYFSSPAITPDQGHHGAKGYLVPAREILDHAPAKAVIGSLQSGALSWLATEQRIVNLDGVVDRDARTALETRTLGAFAQARGVTHLADWDVNVKRFRERAGASAPTLRRIYEASRQGQDEAFVLYEVTWPDGPADLRGAGLRPVHVVEHQLDLAERGRLLDEAGADDVEKRVVEAGPRGAGQQDDAGGLLGKDGMKGQ